MTRVEKTAPEDEDSTVRLEVGLPVDDSGYLRQECPACALEFKLKGDESRFSDALAWWASRAVADAGLAEAPDDDDGDHRACPYCSHSAAGQEFLSEEHRDYVIRVAYREIVEPMFMGFMDEMEQAFSGGSRSRGGLVSISISVERDDSGRSPRPIAGPDPNDMLAVRCLGCDERFKLFEGWAGDVACPSCSASLRLE